MTLVWPRCTAHRRRRIRRRLGTHFHRRRGFFVSVQESFAIFRLEIENVWINGNTRGSNDTEIEEPVTKIPGSFFELVDLEGNFVDYFFPGMIEGDVTPRFFDPFTFYNKNTKYNELKK